MTYRLVGTAEGQIDRILFESAREFGIDTAARYHRLILATMAVVADSPERLGSRSVHRVTGVRAYPLRLARALVEQKDRVARPRHLIVYRIGTDGVVEVLGVVHDRMALSRAARRVQEVRS